MTSSSGPPKKKSSSKKKTNSLEGRRSGGVAGIAKAFTTLMLEKETGVARTTICFYVRLGLLPVPHKTATGRSLYSEKHVAFLRKIGELKEAGRSLSDIKLALGEDLARAGDTNVDLAEVESSRMRADIIKVASEEFTMNGYRGTHVMTIIQKLGINPHVFYRHFPSKLELLVECFKAATPPPIAILSQRGTAPYDVGENVLRGLVYSSQWQRLSAVLSVAIRSEEPQDGPGGHGFKEAWETIIANITRDFENVRDPESPRPLVSDELLAYGLPGFYRNMRFRLSWDDKFDTADLLRAHLFMFLALFAALAGEIDIYSQVARYESYIQELAAQNPELSPALEL